MTEKATWRHKEVSTVAINNTTTIWKSQKSIAPDGKKFVGLRKFVVKKDGSEQVTTSGLSVQVMEDKSHRAEIQALIDLLEGLL
jgi:hypothetical protein